MIFKDITLESAAVFIIFLGSLVTALGILYVALCKAVNKIVEPQIRDAKQNVVDPYGTEEYVDTRDVSVPVGHSTFYPKDLKRKLEELPDPPSGANGTYILKATINNGVTTYSWVVE